MIVPKCNYCGKPLTEVIDTIAKKKTGHIFKCKNCMPDWEISIG